MGSLEYLLQEAKDMMQQYDDKVREMQKVCYPDRGNMNHYEDNRMRWNYWRGRANALLDLKRSMEGV